MTSSPGPDVAWSSCWATPTEPVPVARWETGTPNRSASSFIRPVQAMSGYLLKAAAAESTDSMTPGNGGYGFSLEDSLKATGPSVEAGLPGTYAGTPSSSARSLGLVSLTAGPPRPSVHINTAHHMRIGHLCERPRIRKSAPPDGSTGHAPPRRASEGIGEGERRPSSRAPVAHSVARIPRTGELRPLRDMGRSAGTCASMHDTLISFPSTPLIYKAFKRL